MSAASRKAINAAQKARWARAVSESRFVKVIAPMGDADRNWLAGATYDSWA